MSKKRRIRSKARAGGERWGMDERAGAGGRTGSKLAPASSTRTAELGTLRREPPLMIAAGGDANVAMTMSYTDRREDGEIAVTRAM